jgi:acyl carrier protein
MPHLSREQVIAIVSKAIADSLFLSGRPVPNEIAATTKIIGEVEGFDSPAGVDVTVDLELQLGIALPHNVFVKTVNGRPRARTLNEVVDVLCRMLGAKES